jgi:steroid 5-alpha reductase family enzyme
MLSLNYFSGSLSSTSLAMLLLCLLVSAIGFWRHVYFISIGYGYSIAAMGVVALVLTGSQASLVSWMECLLLIAYGARLGTYLVIRETRPAYRASQKADADRPARMGLGLKSVIWVTVSVLYVCMFMPALARTLADQQGIPDPLGGLSILGIATMALGLVIEVVADAQKNAAKKKDPRRFCDTGLYRFCRYPNYFGEMLVWTGNLIAGASLLDNWLAWLLAALGYISIILIMLGAGRRLEAKQAARYGEMPEFRDYVARTPVLLPFLPLYTLRNIRLYLG